MKPETFIKCAFAGLCGVAAFLWGEMDGLFTALLAFMVIDYITGVFVGIKRKKLDSNTGFIGILRKITMLLIVAVGHLLDALVLGGESDACRSVAIGFYLSNEGISILENTAKLGVKYPKKLIEVLKQLKGEDDVHYH